MTDQPSANDKTSDAASAVPKKKKRRLLLKITAFLIVILLTFVFFLPTIVSTGFGTGIVLSFVNKSLPGEIEIDDLEVGWFSSTSVKGFRLKDPDGKVVIAATIDTPGVTLLSLIQGDMALGEVTLTADEVNIEQYEDGSLNLERALGPSEEKDDKPTTYPKGLSVRLAVKVPKATFKPYNQEAAVLTEGVVNLDIASGQQIAGTITGLIQQGDLHGSINTAADVKDLFATDGTLQISKLKIEAPDNHAEFPTKLIDSLANAQGKLAAIAGPTIRATYGASGSLSDLKAKVNVKGDRLAINANASVKLDDDLKLVGLTLDDGELLHVFLTKDTFKQLAKDADGKQTTTVDIFPANDLVITNSKVDLPPGEGGSGIDLIRSTATFTVAPMKFTIKDPKLGERTLTLDAFTVRYDGPNGLVAAKLNATTGQGTETGTFVGDATVKNPFKADGTIDFDKLTFALDAQVKDFSLALLDELLMTDGILAKAIGGKLNATAKLDLIPADGGNKGNWSLIAKSDQLDANLQGPVTATRKQTDKGVVFDNVVMKLSQPGRVSTRLSKPVIALLKEKVVGIDALFERADLTDRGVTLTVTSFEGPLDGTLLAKANADIAVQIDSFAVDLNTGEQANPDLKLQLQTLAVTAVFAGQAKPVVVGVSSMVKQGTQIADLKATATVTDLFNADGKLDTDSLAATINAEFKNLPTAIVGAFIKQQDLTKEGLGESINLTLNADAKLTKVNDAYTYDGDGNVTIKSTNTDIKLTGKLVGNRLQLNTAPEASYATVILTRELAAAFQKGAASDPADTSKATQWNIAKATPINLTFEKADLPINGDLSSAVLVMNATMGELALTGDPRFDGASIRGFKATVIGNTIGKQLAVTIDGDLIHHNEKGKLAVTATVTQPLENTRGINASVTVQNAPTALVDAFANMDGLIGKLEGKAIKSVVASFKRSANTPDTFGVDVQSASIQGGFAGTYVPGQRMTMLPDQRVTATLNAQAWPIIKTKFADQLPAMLRDATEVSGTVTFNIESMNLALAEVKATPRQANAGAKTATQTTAATAPDPAAPAADATTTKIIAGDSRMVLNGNAKDLYIQRANTNRAVKFENVSVKLDAAQSLNEAKVSLAATPASIPLANGKPVVASPQPAQAHRGELKVNAVAKGLADKDGYFSPSFTNVNASIAATNVSAAALDDALDQGGLLKGLFVDNVNLTSDVAMSPGKPGTFTLNLTSGNAFASTKGIIENDVIKLTEDFKAAVMLTKDMPDAVRNFLVIVKVVSDEKPVSLTIPAKGFSVPLNFGEGDLIDIKKVQADIAFSLGTVKAEGDGIAATVANMVVQATGAQKQAGRLTTAAFSPGNIVIKDGKVTYKEPMQMDYGGVSFSYNGQIDLVTKSLDNLSITIPFASIKAKEVQSLAGGIPIPIGGNLDAPKLDGGKLTKELVNVALKAGLNRGLGELIPGGNKGGLPGIGDLFPPKNKPKPDKPDDGKSGTDAGNNTGNNSDNTSNAGKKPDAKDAAIDILRGVLGDNKPKPKDEPKKEDDNKEQKKE